MGEKERSDNEYVRDMVAIISNNKWTLPVMYALKDGAKRYSEIHNNLAEVTQKVLTETLTNMEQNSLINRTVYPTKPPQVEYNLTDSGTSLLDIVVMLVNWTKSHFGQLEPVQEIYDLPIDEEDKQS